MGLFRYIVQGFGWEIGREAAREGIDALKQQPEPEQLTEKEKQKLLAEAAKQAAQEKKEREAAVARKQAEIDKQLAEMKKKLR